MKDVVTQSSGRNFEDNNRYRWWNLKAYDLIQIKKMNRK